MIILSEVIILNGDYCLKKSTETLCRARSHHLLNSSTFFSFSRIRKTLLSGLLLDVHRQSEKQGCQVEPKQKAIFEHKQLQRAKAVNYYVIKSLCDKKETIKRYGHLSANIYEIIRKYDSYVIIQKYSAF